MLDHFVESIQEVVSQGNIVMEKYPLGGNIVMEKSPWEGMTNPMV
jgi:hypothetical protein